MAALLAAALCCTAVRAGETLPQGARLVKIEAQPASVTLSSPYQYAQVVLTGVLDNGERLDVTRMVQVQKPSCLKVSSTVMVRPTADGAGVLSSASPARRQRFRSRSRGKKRNMRSASSVM